MYHKCHHAKKQTNKKTPKGHIQTCSKNALIVILILNWCSHYFCLKPLVCSQQCSIWLLQWVNIKGYSNFIQFNSCFFFIITRWRLHVTFLYSSNVFSQILLCWCIFLVIFMVKTELQDSFLTPACYLFCFLIILLSFPPLTQPPYSTNAGHIRDCWGPWREALWFRQAKGISRKVIRVKSSTTAPCLQSCKKYIFFTV